MIQSLRSRHRRIFLAFALILPAVFTAGLASRHVHAKKRSAKSELFPGQLFERTAAVRNNALRIRVVAMGDQNKFVELELLHPDELLGPDVLVYWTPGAVSSNLPAEAELLGPFVSGRSYAVPVTGPPRGSLVFYSAATRQVLGTIAIGAAQ